MFDFAGFAADLRPVKPIQMLILAAMLLIALSAPGFAAGYPITGNWSQSTGSEKGAVDCSKLRVIEFKGDQRTDSKGGVPVYRVRSVSPTGPSSFSVVDEFTTGPINKARLSYTLNQVGADHVEINTKPGGMLKLQRCE